MLFDYSEKKKANILRKKERKKRIKVITLKCLTSALLKWKTVSIFNLFIYTFLPK